MPEGDGGHCGSNHADPCAGTPMAATPASGYPTLRCRGDVVLGLRGLRGRVRELRVRAISVGGHPMVEHLGGTRAGQFACWAGLQWGGAAVVGARYWSDRGGAD